MNFIKKIFSEKVDDAVHLQFQKFGKGEFKNKAIISARNSKEKFTISTGPEFANEIVRMLAEKLEDNETKVTGAIITTIDLTGQLDFKTKKQFQGVKNYGIEGIFSGKKIIEFLNRFPRAFFALSFEVQGKGLSVKIKPKSPRSTKPKTKEDAPKADFCKITSKNQGISPEDNWLLNDFIFETASFKQAEVKHEFIITDLIIQKDEKDYLKIREEAIRKGKIIRTAIIDGKEIKTEKEFKV